MILFCNNSTIDDVVLFRVKPKTPFEKPQSCGIPVEADITPKNIMKRGAS